MLVGKYDSIIRLQHSTSDVKENNIPDEIYLLIFQNFKEVFSELDKIALVCKRWHRISSDSTLNFIIRKLFKVTPVNVIAKQSLSTQNSIKTSININSDYIAIVFQDIKTKINSLKIQKTKNKDRPKEQSLQFQARFLKLIYPNLIFCNDKEISSIELGSDEFDIKKKCDFEATNEIFIDSKESNVHGDFAFMQPTSSDIFIFRRDGRIEKIEDNQQSKICKGLTIQKNFVAALFYIEQPIKSYVVRIYSNTNFKFIFEHVFANAPEKIASDDERIAVALKNGELKVFQALTGVQIEINYSNLGKKIDQLQFYQKNLIVVLRDRTFLIYNLDGQLVLNFRCEHPQTSNVEWLLDMAIDNDKIAFIEYTKSQVEIRSLKTGNLLGHFKTLHPPIKVKFKSNDFENYLVAVLPHGKIQIWKEDILQPG